MNEWICETTADSEIAVPFATVHAADEDVSEIVETAFEHGARGLKFQLPVQGFGADDPRLDPAYEVATEWDCPVLFYAGTAPMFRDSPAVGIERFRSFVNSYPEIRACGAHMGTYEHEAFMNPARDREDVFLDTTFAMSAVAETYMVRPHRDYRRRTDGAVRSNHVRLRLLKYPLPLRQGACPPA